MKKFEKISLFILFLAIGITGVLLLERYIENNCNNYGLVYPSLMIIVSLVGCGGIFCNKE